MRRRPRPALRPEKALEVWDATPPAAGPAVVTAHCTLRTPMYGGGVTPGRVDRELPIRPSALRGQLRFWWRLLHGRSRPATEVFQAESALWGGISSGRPRASRVALQVRAERVEAEELRTKDDIQHFPDYVLILNAGDQPKLLDAGYAFDLTLRFHPTTQPEQRAQVVEALRWWASFGGVGARTRRGLGAVHVTSDDTELQPVSCREVEAVGGRMVLGPAMPTAIDARGAVAAWREAVDALKNFRQGPNLGRSPGSRPNRPGRSRWPEPDTIRRLTGEWVPGHEPQHPVDGFYPRAAFGLPIVFHFKDRGDPKARSRDSKARSDQGLTLVPKDPYRSDGKDPDRMASPLILRPYFDGTGCRPLALLLPGWEQRISVPVGFDVESASPAWPSSAEERKRLAGQIEPMGGRGDDALSAFMAYFAERTADRDPTRRTRGTRRR